MKLICAEYNEQGESSVGVIGDNALLRNNEDFYYPVFTKELSCVPQLVLRACKLGKGVGERFANRYYDEIGVGIRFYADTFEKELRQKGLPDGVAAAFDGAAALSSMEKYEDIPVPYRFLVNETTCFEGDITDLPLNVNRFISLASDFFMIKIGDFFYCGNPFRYRNLRIGDRLRMYLKEQCLLDFRIR